MRVPTPELKPTKLNALLQQVQHQMKAHRAALHIFLTDENLKSEQTPSC